jgi:hypothetical protein
MRRFFLTPFALLLVLIPVLALSSVIAAPLADEPPADKQGEKPPDIAPPTEKEEAGERMKFMRAALGRFTSHVGEHEEPFTAGDPCLRWTNPIDGVPDGIVAVYAHKSGRPTALGQIFVDGQKQWCNEFTILAESDVTIRRSDRLFWKPSEYVSTLTDLPRSPRPSDEAVARLAQMRSIAGDFSAINYSREAKQPKQDLRLLPQPDYRYSEKGKILDGALFAFTLGTDPECCLVLEAYKDNKGAHYRYLVAPMTTARVEVRYKDQLVWEIGPRAWAGFRSHSYYAGNYEAEPGEVVPK